MSRLKQLVRIADEKAHALVSPMRKNSNEEAVKAYRRTVFEWKHTYISWIKEQGEDVNSYEPSAAERHLEQVLESNGEWVVFCTETGCVSEKAADYFLEALSGSSNDVSVMYGDEDYTWNGALQYRMCPFFKPDFSPETLLSFSYFGEIIFLKKTITEKTYTTKLSTINHADALTIYDLSLKATLLVGDKGVQHIGHIMYHRSAEDLTGLNVMPEKVTSDDDFYAAYDAAENRLTAFLESDNNISKVLVGCGADGVEIRKNALDQRKIKAVLEQDKSADIYRIIADTSEAKISVVILSKDNPELLEKCIGGIRKLTEYPNYEIVVVDNGSNENNKKVCEELSRKYDFLYYHHPMEFNFSALCNYGVEKTDGELILLMNDDVEIISGEYMRLMAGIACRNKIGAVGARLRYGDGISIQHVGVTSLGIGPSHQLQRKSDDKNRYFGRNRVEYEMLGVTAACLMVKRSVYEEVGGLDEGLKVAYNDVDFCMKITKAGYRNVQCNGAVLLHHESLTRGFDGDSDEKWYRLLAEKEGLYKRHPEYKKMDPYHSDNLIDNSSEYVCSHKTYAQNLDYRSVVEYVDNQEINGRSFGFRLTMDHTMMQRRFNPEDEDFFWIDGWIYVPGADHTLIKKCVMLRDTEKNSIYRVHSCDVYRYDVEELLPAAKNVAMSGFLARISPTAIPAGTFKVGVELTCTDKKSCIWTERTITN